MVKTWEVLVAITESGGVFVSELCNNFLERVIQFCLQDIECQTF
jgi:hypothetical protein